MKLRILLLSILMVSSITSLKAETGLIAKLNLLQNDLIALKAEIRERKDNTKTGFIISPENEYKNEKLNGWRELWSEGVDIKVDSIILIHISGHWETKQGSLGVMINGQRWSQPISATRFPVKAS